MRRLTLPRLRVHRSRDRERRQLLLILYSHGDFLSLPGISILAFLIHDSHIDRYLHTVFFIASAVTVPGRKEGRRSSLDAGIP